MNKITAMDIKRYLETEAQPLSTHEFSEFWSSCNEEEKEAFRKQVAELKK